MQAIVFDSQSLLKLYLGEPGSEKVVELLRSVLEAEVKASINIVNLAEIYYILHRRSREAAEEKEENLRNYGVKVVPVDPESPLWKKAASLKAQHTMSLADAFAAATALELKSRLVTGADKDFDGIQGLKIERV
ncbi:MAG TPA: PIN domain-containing protein [Nitrososphaerales archaeon]|nr:PIN domain-containing protein [Nitrososphaerales archaeon]